MKVSSIQAALGSALLLSVNQVEANHHHNHHAVHFSKRHTHNHLDRHAQVSPREAAPVRKRAVCSLPTDGNLYHVPGAENNGFAMSSNQPCTEGKYCPIACPAGQVMNQWEKGSTYTYPASMNGGLLCGPDGVARKPFDSEPYCVDGAGTVKAINKVGKRITFCQTVLPGNEDILIPTLVDGEAILAVPKPSYWCGTSAHYYINPPGVGLEGCRWGDRDTMLGNWTPFVAGANQDAQGSTFVTLSWNPIFAKEENGVKNNKLTYGVRIECPEGGCNGLPCEINPAESSLNVVKSNLQATGAGGANFCVVTVPPGKSANIIIFPTDGQEVDGPSKGDDNSSTPSSSEKFIPTVKPGIFHENGTHHTHDDDELTSTTKKPSASRSSNPTVPTTSSQNSEGAGRHQGSAAVVGLIVALVAAACFY